MDRAVQNRDLASVRALLARGGADPNRATNGGETPLHWLFSEAAASSHTRIGDMMQLLLNSGASGSRSGTIKFVGSRGCVVSCRRGPHRAQSQRAVGC